MHTCAGRRWDVGVHISLVMNNVIYDFGMLGA